MPQPAVQVTESCSFFHCTLAEQAPSLDACWHYRIKNKNIRQETNFPILAVQVPLPACAGVCPSWGHLFPKAFQVCPSTPASAWCSGTKSNWSQKEQRGAARWGAPLSTGSRQGAALHIHLSTARSSSWPLTMGPRTTPMASCRAHAVATRSDLVCILVVFHTALNRHYGNKILQIEGSLHFFTFYTETAATCTLRCSKTQFAVP